MSPKVHVYGSRAAAHRALDTGIRQVRKDVRNDTGFQSLRLYVPVPLEECEARRLWPFTASPISMVHPIDDIPWNDPDVGEVRALLVHVHTLGGHVEEAMLLYRPDPEPPTPRTA